MNKVGIKNSERYYCIAEIFGDFDLINDNGMCEFKERSASSRP